jgi:hypothetical protein
MEKKKSVLRDKSDQFAVWIVKFSLFIQQDKKEFVPNRQLLRNCQELIGMLVATIKILKSKQLITLSS